jgi:peptidylprolyl isomerase
MKKRLVAFIAAIAAFTLLASPSRAATDPENLLYLDLEDGRVVIEMLPDIAPRHVSRIKELTRQGFYDGLTFHRVISGFMAQGGDPDGTGAGGTGVHIPAEFSTHPFRRGVVGAARTLDPNSADSQFFIMFDEEPSLNGQYTVWGRVISGMEHVDKLNRCQPSETIDTATGLPAVRHQCEVPGTSPDKIVKMQVAADVAKAAPASASAPAPAQ